MSHEPFLAENPFSPVDKFVFTGLVGQSCHFDVIACSEARQLNKKENLMDSGHLWESTCKVAEDQVAFCKVLDKIYSAHGLGMFKNVKYQID